MLMLIILFLSTKDNEKISKLIRKEFKRSAYWNEFLQQKVRIKTRQMNIDIFSNQNLLK